MYWLRQAGKSVKLAPRILHSQSTVRVGMRGLAPWKIDIEGASCHGCRQPDRSPQDTTQPWVLPQPVSVGAGPEPWQHGSLPPPSAPVDISTLSTVPLYSLLAYARYPRGIRALASSIDTHTLVSSYPRWPVLTSRHRAKPLNLSGATWVG